MFVGEWGRVESLLGLLVGDWGADLQIRGGGVEGTIIQTLRPGGRSRASVWSKNKGGRASSGSATG